ncbi:MAG: peptidase [Bacteroidetes bacterium]|nr:peptidase [Bacteroidota bacterium]
MRKVIPLLLIFFCTIKAIAQPVPSPKDFFGFNIGDNYQLATFTQTEAYFKKLEEASDRAKLVEIGKTEEGRSQFMLIVSAPENIKKLERYKSISEQLAHAEGLTDEQAKALAAEGKAVVWIDGGLHATETVGIHQLIETAWTLLSRNDDETINILKNVIVLLTHANPDGQELVSNWYMRTSVPEKRSLQFLPTLYQKYIGHDNNRDFYMMNMKETQNMARQLFIEWIPQIMYNHHQSGPAGSVLAGPPYRDPFNYVFDPLIISGLEGLGAAMQNRLNAEGKPGYTSKSGSVFSTWYNGGLRTTTYFHNMLGLLTEITGSPNPSNIPLVPQRLIPNNATPNPVTPQKWLFRQSIEYSVSLNYAVLNYASRNRDELLYNIYRMGKNSILKGEKDTWSLSPSKINDINHLYQSSQRRNDSSNQTLRPVPSTLPARFYDSVMKDPQLRDPRGYIIPSDQPDFPTAVNFLNALIRTGVIVQKAKSEFSVGGKKYPANSYIVKTNQAFRPHILDLFEPQDHPNDFQYPGGPPVAPYDAAGWTLAYQMGVKFDRILDAFDGPFEKNPQGELLKIKGQNNIAASAKGYLLDAAANVSYKAVNDLLKENIEVYRVSASTPGIAGVGSFYIPANIKAKSILQKISNEDGLNIITASSKPASLQKIKPSRIALWDTYGGSMPSGWIRWLLEQNDYSFNVIYSKEIDAGGLRSKYDAILFVPGAIPGLRLSNQRGFFRRDPSPDSIPAEFRSHIGRITADTSVPQLKKFLEEGGRIITIGSSANLAYHLGLPVSNALVEIDNGVERNLPEIKYFIPGSILSAMVDNNDPAAWGMDKTTDVYFDNSPVFDVKPEALNKGDVKPLLWFGAGDPLRSGWAWGKAYLKNKVTAFSAPVGKGTLYVFGPEITFRGQSAGTFKLLFNELYTNSK